MSEALCGPSNALQNLQKHTSVDTTLQQDRLALRNSTSQSFRSSPASGTPHLDAEFRAFQNGRSISGAPIPFTQGPLIPFVPAPFTSIQAPQTALPSWASDFQQMHLNEERTSPLSAAHFRHEAPLQRRSPSGWSQEFMQQHEQQSLQQTFQQPYMSHNFSGLARGQIPQYAGIESANSHMFPTTQQQQPLHAETIYDEAAFDQAFDAVQLDLAQSISKGKERDQAEEDQQNEPERFNMNNACTEPGDILGGYDYEHNYGARLEQETDVLQQLRTMRRDGGWEALEAFERAHEQDILDSNSQLSRDIVDTIRAMRAEEEVVRTQPVEPAGDAVRIGADAILGAESEEAVRNPQIEADELSRTAGELLDNLKNEQSQKFQQSSFMELMRQLRDREVRVEGDKMVSTVQESHPGGRFYPYDAFDTASNGQFLTMPEATQATA